jgi:hypothetical protein
MYDKNISTREPSLVLFLIDQSSSMGGAWGNSGISRMVLASNALNQTLYDLALHACMKGDEIADRIHVGIVSYGAPNVSSILGGSKGWEPATTWVESYNRISKVPVGHDGNRVIESEIPIWVEPKAINGTPMAEALQLAGKIVSNHSSEYPSSHPPIVINITDGEAGGISPPARAIRSCSTEDGDALLFTIQISSDGGHPLLFPTEVPPSASSYTTELFNISSEIPSSMASRARQMGIHVPEGGRGIVLNADPLALTSFLSVGTTLTLSSYSETSVAKDSDLIYS